MKLKLIIATFLSMFLFSAAQAGSFGMGVTGGIGMIGAAGSETNSESGSETETGEDATASNDIGFAELYAEYSFGDCGCIDESQITDDSICTEEYQPVCGCNQVTYGNDCYAENNGVTEWTEGECIETDSY